MSEASEAARILIVEDEQIVALDVRLQIERMGYRSAGSYPTAEEAIAHVEHDPPDLVLMDINLAGQMDGLSAAQVILNRFDIPVVMVTAYNDEDTLVRAANITPYGYVTKPYEARELRTAIVMAMYRHATQRELARANRLEAIALVSGGLAHNFNNLVTVILGHARLALDELEELEDHGRVRKNVEGIYNTARHSMQLTRRLLALARSETQQPALVNLPVAVSGAVGLFGGSLLENRRVEVAAHTDEAMVRVDSSYLDQVLLNLLLNARDATAIGGTITVATEALTMDAMKPLAGGVLLAGRYAVLHVSDTGHGIDAAVLPRIFEPFFTTKNAATGSGLGLATVYAFAVQNGGAVDVRSAAGSGTRFSVYLPMVDQKPSAGAGAADRVEEIAGTERVMVVLDDNMLRSTTCELLRARGFQPTSARCVGEALLLLEAQSDVRLLITDLSAAWLSASEIVARYRAVTPAPVLVVKTDSTIETHDADASIVQPFEPRDLLKMARTLIDAGGLLAQR